MWTILNTDQGLESKATLKKDKPLSEKVFSQQAAIFMAKE
ncbi:hypothetical protein LRHMDP2_1818 [Lacticaseibacillus rhamnosus LRHMDP2]|uniref:Uncharacterized protein n=1 Tax=Lacticaseibacillus rhamnosus LRHMDP3 TaxID=1203259 RepID=A0AB33XXB3_LACRH|nr:hypothetical protein LRHMDP2_1818 [Lacticaseibacillus rhamnosus LRHMDP2]EKS52357.1 hypothetical protein LRHMDP3_728 [Lacticaseibacillus rhamnosus LRHMDP3]